MTLQSRIESNRSWFYPEVAAGGFSRKEGWIDFYGRISALIHKDMTVLDYGAGRGAAFYIQTESFSTSLGIFKGRVQKLVGVDIDPAVLDNPFLDEAHVVGLGEQLPFPDQSFDLIYSDWVIEHVDTPELFESEIRRLLKPGGWFCARTPNRWGTTGLATNLIPNALHTKVLARLNPDRQDRDVFPTVYKLNTIGRLNRYFSKDRWQNCSYFHSPEPGYVLRSKLLTALFNLYTAGPNFLGTNLHVFLRKI